MPRHHRTARQAYERYARAHQLYRDLATGKTEAWNSHCGSFVLRLVRGKTPYLTAKLAHDSSHNISKVAGDAGVGAVHFWDVTAGNSAGHVGIQIDVQGNIAMASGFLATATPPASGLGTNTVLAYSKASGATYLGWSKAYGRNSEWTVADFGQPHASKKIAVKTQGSKGLQVADSKITKLKPEQPSALVKRVAAYLNSRNLGHGKILT